MQLPRKKADFAAPVCTIILLVLCAVLSAYAARRPDFVLTREQNAASLYDTARIPAEAFPADGVNINTASAADLEELPGIGSVLAARIIAYREAHGAFRHPFSIVAVEGIGEAKYEEIKAYITIK